jgi:hypothetical protein
VLALTFQGMFAAQAGMAELDAPGHPLGGVWSAAGALVAAIDAIEGLEARTQPSPS